MTTLTTITHYKQINLGKQIRSGTWTWKSYNRIKNNDNIKNNILSQKILPRKVSQTNDLNHSPILVRNIKFNKLLQKNQTAKVYPVPVSN